MDWTRQLADECYIICFGLDRIIQLMNYMVSLLDWTDQLMNVVLSVLDWTGQFG